MPAKVANPNRLAPAASPAAESGEGQLPNGNAVAVGGAGGEGMSRIYRGFDNREVKRYNFAMNSMSRLRKLSVGLLGFMLSCGHSDGPPSATTDQACEILRTQPAVPVIGGGYAQGPGDTVVASTQKLDISLPESVAAPDVHGGRVQWVVQTPGIYGIFREESVPFLVRDGAGNSLPFLKQAGASVACTSINRRAFIELPAGTFSLEFIASELTKATVVLLPLVPGERL